MKTKPFILYVAPEGDDRWSGQLAGPNAAGTDGPFASLTQARDCIRQRKAEGAYHGPVSVRIRGGLYPLSAPLRFTAGDSGTAECPVVYEAMPGGSVVLSGGRLITGWTPAEGGLWKAEIPSARNNGWPFRQLFVNGQRRRRARLPETGSYFDVVDALVPDQQDHPDNKRGFRFNPDQLKSIPCMDHAEVIVLHRWDISIGRVQGIDVQARSVTLATPAHWNINRGRRFFIDNVVEGLAHPGAWFLDGVSGIIYYRPMPGEDISRAEVMAPVLEQLLVLEGEATGQSWVEHLTFRGLTFAYADWRLPEAGVKGLQASFEVPGVIHAQGARHCAFLDNTIAHAGTYGVELGRGCYANRIAGNHFHDLGAGGIKIGEAENRPDDRDEARMNEVTDNRIHDSGHVYMGAVGIWVGQSSRNLVAHNEIFDLFYTGISVGWNWTFLPPNRTRDNVIEFNHIHHLMKNTLSDGGGIYTLGVQPGTVIRNNLIHDIYGKSSSRGIYLDGEGSYGILIENNIVHHTLSPGLRLQVGTTGNVIMNNIFALAHDCQLGIDTDRTNVFVRNIVYWKDSVLFARPCWDSYDTVFDYNIYYDAGGKEVRFMQTSFAGWQKFRWQKHPNLESRSGEGCMFNISLDGHSLVADPLFEDPDAGNFNLKPDSPALQLGFKPIDMSSVGPRAKAASASCSGSRQSIRSKLNVGR